MAEGKRMGTRAIKAAIVARCPGLSEDDAESVAAEVERLAAGDPGAIREHLDRVIADLSNDTDIDAYEVFYQDEIWDE